MKDPILPTPFKGFRIYWEGRINRFMKQYEVLRAEQGYSSVLKSLLKTSQNRHSRGNFIYLSWVLKHDISQESCVTPVFVAFIVTVNRYQTRSDLTEKNFILSQGVRGHVPQRQRQGVCIWLYQKGKAACLHFSMGDGGRRRARANLSYVAWL